MIDRRVDISPKSKVWMVLACLAVVLYVLLQLSNAIAAGSIRSALLLDAAFAGFFVVARISGDWRRGVYFFFVWLLFEDLIRKYMGNNMFVYFGKDALVGVTYVSFLAAEPRGESILFRSPFRHALGLFVLLGLVQVFNPFSPSIFYGLLGLKLYFYYIPLMFLGYAMLRKEEDLRRFLVLSVVLAGVISLVGILQAIVGLDFLNPRGGADIDELSHLVRYTHSGLAVPRPPSVFVSDGRFAAYLVLAFILGLGAAGYLQLRSGRGRKLVLSAVGLIALAAVLGGGRGAFSYVVASAVLLSVGMLWGAPTSVGASYRLVTAIRRSFFFVAVAVTLIVSLFPDVIGARIDFYRESLMPNSEYSEAGSRVWDYPLGELVTALSDPHWVTGHGIGTASLGVQYVSRILDAPPADLGVENGYGTMILEFGILGPFLWLAWASALLFAALKVVMRLKGTWAFPMGLSILWFAFILLFPATYGGMQAYQNFVLNAYFWLLVGILFRLPALVSENSNEPQVSFALAH